MKHTKPILAAILFISLTFSACFYLPGPKEPNQQEVFDFVEQTVDTENYSYIDCTKSGNKTTYHFSSNQRDLLFDATSWTDGAIKDTYDLIHSGAGVNTTYWEKIYTMYYEEEFKKIVDSHFDNSQYTYTKGSLSINSNYSNEKFLSGPKYKIKVESKEDVDTALLAYSEINDYYLANESTYHTELLPICYIQIAMDDDNGKETTGATYPIGDSYTKKTRDDILSEFALYMIRSKSHGFYTDEELQAYYEQHPEWISKYENIYINGEEIKFSNWRSWVQYNKDTKKQYVAIREFDGEDSILLDYLNAFHIPCTDYKLSKYTKDYSQDWNARFKFNSNGNTYEIKVYNDSAKLTGNGAQSSILILKNNSPMQCDTYNDGRYVFVDLDSFCEIMNAEYHTENFYDFHFTSKP